MLYTLADARQVCKPHVDGGSCDTAKIDARINEAISRVLDIANWYEIMRTMRVRVCRKCIALPSNVESVIGANIDGSSSFAFNHFYQFIHAGRGDLDNSPAGGSCYKDLMDLGDHFPTMFDIPTCFDNPRDVAEQIEVSGLPLIAFSTEVADVGKTVLMSGLKSNGEAISAEVPIVLWKNSVEGSVLGTWGDARLPLATGNFAVVERVTKPATAGYISVFAVHAATGAMFGIAKYLPAETLPRFRRYTITNSSSETASSLQLRVRLRFIPLVHATDLIPFEQLHTVKLAVMAISEENAKSWEDSDAAFAKAVSLLMKREEAKVTASGNPVIMDSMARASYARRMNRIGVI